MKSQIMKDKIINFFFSIKLGLAYLVIGLMIGWFLFSKTNSNSSETSDNHEHSKNNTNNNDEIWTCSMHPQIRQNEPGDCPICGMDLIPLAKNSNDDSPIKLVMTEQATKLAHIETMIVGDKEIAGNTINKELFLTGKAKMDETKWATQASHFEGRIERLLIEYTGETVKKNQKIAVIYAPELINAQKELLETVKLKDKYPALYEAAKEKIRQWKLPETTIDAIENSGKIQREIAIFAERSGVVMKRYVEEGDYIKKGTPLFDIMDLNRVWVLFDVYEKDMQWIKVGTSVKFNFDAMPQKTYQSKITFIDPIINPKTRVASARVEIKNVNGFIKPDMFAKGIVYAVPTSVNKKSAKRKPITVPKTAVLWTGKRSVIYLKDSEMDVPTFLFKEVTLGIDLGDSYIIEEGIEEGDEIVVNGAFRVDAAAQLNNKSSMMNRLVSIKPTIAPQDLPLPDYRKKTSPKFKQQLADFTEQYLEVKDMLVATNFEKTKKAAKSLDQSFYKVDMLLLEGIAHQFWMEKMTLLKTNIEKIKTAKDIETQRMWFSGISEILTEVVVVYGLPEGTFYVQYCPMALDDKGANWLSKEERVLNPYFGDKMLKCGTVNESFNFQ